MRHRAAALAIVFVLLAVGACGNRSDDAEPTTTSTAGGEDTTSTTAPEAPMVGTLVSPCGPGEPADPSNIKIATIADIGGLVPGLGQEMWDAMDAFVAYCNSLGGINGRPLELQKLDSELFKHREATQAACDSALALVGSGAPFDDGGAQVGVDCGIPDIPGYATHPAHALATNVVQPLPNVTYRFSTGPGQYIAEQHPEAVKNAAVVWPAVATTELQAKRLMEAYSGIGYTFTYTGTTNAIETDYAPAAKAIKDSGAEYLNFVSEGSQLALLATALRDQGYFPEVLDAGPAAYNQEFLAAGGDAIEGTYVSVTTWPFEEADESPALQVYIEWLEKARPDATPDALGVQAFSAGLLFATAAKAAGDDLTRESLMAELKKIHSWDGGGLHGESDPAAGEPSGCFAYFKVTGGKFVREFPDEGFECDTSKTVDLKGDYGAGAA